MEFSNALPIQFWPVIIKQAGGTQALRILFTDATFGSSNTPTTFNELQNQAGVNAAPYFSPLDITDDIVVQFMADPGSTVYRLNMIRDDGHALVFNQAFSEVTSGVYQTTISSLTLSPGATPPNQWGKYQFSVASTANLVSGNILVTQGIASPEWANQADGGEDWAIAAGSATVTLETQSSPDSNRLLQSFTDTASTDTLSVLLTGTAAQTADRDVRGYVEFRFYKDGSEVTSLRRRSTIQFNRNSQSSASVSTAFTCQLLIPALTTSGIDQFAFSAHITSCDETVNSDSSCLFTVNFAEIAAYSDNMIIYAKSDYHDVYWGGWDEFEAGLFNVSNPVYPIARMRRANVLIKYTSTDDFAGLDFSSSPGPYFNLRVPGTFLHTEYPREEESHELSDEEWVTIWSELTEKRKLEISHVPYYIIRKLNLIFMCDFINVGAVDHFHLSNNDAAGENAGMDVVVRDPLQVNEGDRRYPLKTATVLLTNKDFIKRNLL